MNQEEIIRAFENRWRIKQPTLIYDRDVLEKVKTLCRNFFEAGIALGNGDYSIQRENPIPECREIMTVKEGIAHTKELRFKTWWDLYDLKCGHKDCLKKWMKMSLAEIQACIDATPAYVASTPDKQFRKRPLTYLNQKAWNDEIIPRNNGTNQPTLEQQRKSKLADILTD